MSSVLHFAQNQLQLFFAARVVDGISDTHTMSNHNDMIILFIKFFIFNR
jgi:hypothetical protein